jgi:tetratricopeptide (TPR) repeat protein
MVHDIWGGIAADTEAAKGARLRHFMAINTGWKHGIRAEISSEVGFGNENALSNAMDEVFLGVPRRFGEGNLAIAEKTAFAGSGIAPDVRDRLRDVLVAEFPDSAWVLFLAAREKEKAGDSAAANELFQRVLSIDGTIADAMYYQSFALDKLGDANAALDVADKAFSIASDELRYAVRAVNLALRLKDIKRAERYIDEHIDQASLTPQILHSASRAAKRAGNLTKALDYVARAAAMAPQNRDIQCFYATCLIEQGALDKASNLLDELVQLNNTSAEIHFQRSICSESQGKLNDALRHAQLAVEYGKQQKRFVERRDRLTAEFNTAGTH